MENFIPIPPMSEFLLEEFLKPMNITVHELAQEANIPENELKAILADEGNITPEISYKLGAFFGVSKDLFFNIQTDLISRREEDMRVLQYA